MSRSAASFFDLHAALTMVFTTASGTLVSSSVVASNSFAITSRSAMLREAGAPEDSEALRVVALLYHGPPGDGAVASRLAAELDSVLCSS